MSGFHNLKNKIDNISEFFLKINGVIALIIPSIVLVVVLIRAIIPSGMPIWSLDICMLLMWPLSYLCTGFVLRKGRHITVDILIKTMGQQTRKIIDLIMLACVSIMSIIMMIAGFDVCLDSWMTMKNTSSEFPEYPFSILIPIGLVFLVYEAIALFTKRFSSKDPVQSAGH